MTIYSAFPATAQASTARSSGSRRSVETTSGAVTRKAALVRIVVSRTALGTPPPAARRRRTSNGTHSVSGVSIGPSRGLCGVLRPHTIKHFEQAITFGDERLITAKIDHGQNRFPVLFHNHRILLAGHPPHQLVKGSLGSLVAECFDHTQILVGSRGEVKQRQDGPSRVGIGVRVQFRMSGSSHFGRPRTQSHSQRCGGRGGEAIPTQVLCREK